MHPPSAGTVVNGIDTARLPGALAAPPAGPGPARLRVRAANRWIDGAHSRSEVGAFAVGAHEVTRPVPFVLDAGAPDALLGADAGPTPAEALLHALAACLTSSVVYRAAAMGVVLTEVRCVAECAVDLRAQLGLGAAPPGPDAVRVSMRVAGDAPAARLGQVVEAARRGSAVAGALAASAPVEVRADVEETA